MKESPSEQSPWQTILAGSLLVAVGFCLLLHGLAVIVSVDVKPYLGVAQHIDISLSDEERFVSSALVISGAFLLIIGSILTIKASREYLNK